MFKFTPYWSGREEESLFLEKIASQTIANGLRCFFHETSDQSHEQKSEAEEEEEFFWRRMRPYFSDEFFDGTACFFNMENDIDAGNWFLAKKFHQMMDELEDTEKEYDFDLFEQLIFSTAIRFADDDVTSGFALESKYFNTDGYKEVMVTLKERFGYSDDEAQELADEVSRFNRMLPGDEENLFFWDEDAVYFFRDGFVRGINRIKSYAGTTMGYGFQHASRIFENAGIQPPVLLLGSEAENDAAIAADGERFRERMNQFFRAALGRPGHEDSEPDRERSEPEKAEAFPLTESQIMQADANNRKAKAILGSIVRSIYLSDEDCIDVTEMVLAAYDYVDHTDAILGFGRQKYSQTSE